MYGIEEINSTAPWILDNLKRLEIDKLLQGWVPGWTGLVPISFLGAYHCIMVLRTLSTWDAICRLIYIHPKYCTDFEFTFSISSVFPAFFFSSPASSSSHTHILSLSPHRCTVLNKSSSTVPVAVPLLYFMVPTCPLFSFPISSLTTCSSSSSGPPEPSLFPALNKHCGV